KPDRRARPDPQERTLAALEDLPRKGTRPSPKIGRTEMYQENFLSREEPPVTFVHREQVRGTSRVPRPLSPRRRSFAKAPRLVRPQTQVAAVNQRDMVRAKPPCGRDTLLHYRGGIESNFRPQFLLRRCANALLHRLLKPDNAARNMPARAVNLIV